MYYFISMDDFSGGEDDLMDDMEEMGVRYIDE